MSGFERRIDGKRSRMESLPLGVVKAHEKIKKREKHYNGPEYKIQLPNFVDHYGVEQVIADQQKVVALDKKFSAHQEQWQTEAKKMADVLEAIIVEESEMSNWLGDSVTTRKTTTYDDYINGVDMVAEYRRENGDGFDTLALGIDVTYGAGTVRQKLERIKAHIDNSKMATLKYYEDSEGDFMGQLKNIPQFVLGVDRDTINNLAGLWVEREKQALATHPVQVTLLREILSQAIQFGEYADSCNEPKIANAYAKVARIIRDVLETKRAIPTSHKTGGIAQQIAHDTRAVCSQ